MANKVEVTMSPTTFNVGPGDTIEAMASLRNRGQTVDQFTLSIDGLDSNWYTLPVSSVALFPGDQDQLKILLHPLKAAETKGGSYPFRLKVASQDNPDEIGTVELTLEIRTIPELELDISPKSVTGRKGVYRITTSNPSDTEAKLQLKLSDTHGGLHYALHPETLVIPPHGRSEAKLEVWLGWQAFFGGEKEFEFQVEAELPEAGEPKSLNGQLVRVVWYKSLPRIRLPRLPGIRVPWLTRSPAITKFKAVTDDRREFRLSWAVKRSTEVKLEDEVVEREGEKLVRPTEATTYVLSASNKYGSSSQKVNVNPLPLPLAKASERIRVSMSPTAFQVQAGGAPLQVSLQLQNLGEIVDKFLVEIEGLDETWYNRSASSLALMPQASDQVVISFQPPNKKGVRARTYPFAVKVRSQSRPEEISSIVGQLEVLPVVDFKLAVRPYRVSCRGKGTFRINIANTGVGDANIMLEATDLDEGLKFSFRDENPEVAAWRTVEIPMTARPKRGSFVGEKKRYDITVTASTGEGKTQSVNCELHHNPFMGSWRPILRIIRAIIILGAIGVLIYFVIKWGGGWKTLTGSPQTWVNNLIHTVEGWFFR